MQLDFSDQSAIPVVLNLHHPAFPPNPVTPLKCTPVGIQLVLPGPEGEAGIIDPELYVNRNVYPNLRVLDVQLPPNPCAPTDGR